LAERFADGPACALRAAKIAIDTGLELGPAAGRRVESQLFALLFATEDKDIGIRSYLERGPGQALFVGR
jgi:enoyl-CoA hydratase/carnithine racemase